jgi:hypothetical protein
MGNVQEAVRSAYSNASAFNGSTSVPSSRAIPEKLNACKLLFAVSSVGMTCFRALKRTNMIRNVVPPTGRLIQKLCPEVLASMAIRKYEPVRRGHSRHRLFRHSKHSSIRIYEMRMTYGKGRRDGTDLLHICIHQSFLLPQSTTGHGKQDFPFAQPYLSHVPAG